MKLKIIIFIALWSVLSLLHGQVKKVAVFEEFGQPAGIAIGNGYIYINEKTTVYVYNLKDYKPVGKFGQEGEGPGEMKLNPFGPPLVVIPYNNQVYITNFGKVSIFSTKGQFIKEYKCNAVDSYYPFLDKYICLATTPKEENSRDAVLALFLADENLVKGRLIYKTDFEVGPNAKFDYPITPFYPGFDKDKLFVIAGLQGFAIEAFDKDGKKLYTIKKEYDRVKIPASYKDKTLEWFKKSPNFGQFYDYMKTRITFKDYYPPINTMMVDQGKIYVLTNRMKGEEQRECIVLDLQGKELKKVYLPIPEQYGMDLNFPYTISDNYFYKLAENMDEETWELYKGEI